jgi:hypothetical protein
VVAGSAGNRFGIARLASEPFLKITSVNPLNTGPVNVRGVGVPVANHTLHASPDLGPGSFGALGPVTTDVGGFWQFQDTNAVGLNMRFYRLSYP